MSADKRNYNSYFKGQKRYDTLEKAIKRGVFCRLCCHTFRDGKPAPGAPRLCARCEKEGENDNLRNAENAVSEST